MKGRQKRFPLVRFTCGKYGSPAGISIGMHSGWTDTGLSHGLQSGIEVKNPLMEKVQHLMIRYYRTIGICLLKEVYPYGLA